MWWRKKILKYRNFWGTSPADFSTAGDASPRPRLSTPMMIGTGKTIIKNDRQTKKHYKNQFSSLTGLEKWFQRWRGLGLEGPRGKGSRVSQRAQNYLYNYCNCWKIVQEKVKRAHFGYILGPPSPTQEMKLMGPGGEGPSRSTPISPAISLTKYSHPSSPQFNTLFAIYGIWRLKYWHM